MKFIEVNKNLKEKVEALYNIKGEDLFLIKQAIANIKSFLIKEFEEFNYSKLDAEKLKKEQVDEQILTMPIANDYRLVVLSNPNNEIVKFLNKYNFEGLSTVVVCINAENLNNAAEIDCTKLDKQDVSKYILNQLAKLNMSIEEQALDYIIEATGGNMSKIVNELTKVTSYCVDSNMITIDVVTNLLSNTTEYAIYMLTNAIDSKDYTMYQKILNQMTKAQTTSEIFSYLGKHFKRMQYVALNKDDNQIAKLLNIKPYAIKMSRQNVAKNGVKFYVNLYEKYVELDYKIKSGKITVNNALYELIF